MLIKIIRKLIGILQNVVPHPLEHGVHVCRHRADRFGFLVDDQDIDVVPVRNLDQLIAKGNGFNGIGGCCCVKALIGLLQRILLLFVVISLQKNIVCQEHDRNCTGHQCKKERGKLQAE